MSEAPIAGSKGMSDRAAIAMLTLQLRAAERELVDIEAAERGIDEAAAREQLRAKLAPLEEDRRRALDEACAAARRTADDAVAEARARAERLVAAAAASAMVASTADEVGDEVEGDHMVEDLVEEDPTVVDDPMVVDDRVDADAVDAAVAAPVLDAAVTPTGDDAAAPLVPDEVRVAAPFGPPAASAFPAPTAIPGPTTVVIDAELFARVFATVLAETAELRGHASSTAVPAAPREQPSFWRHARHPDVILLGVATTIVLVVLFAWLA